VLPFIRVADFHIGSFPIHTFGLLVMTAVLFGSSLTVRRARARGVNTDELNSFITWMLLSGFIFAHVLNDLFYEPHLVLKDPLRLLRIWESISSFGGFVGGLIGVLMWKFFYAEPWIQTPLGAIPKFGIRKVPAPILPFCDLVLSVFPVAWIFGRSGCTLAHDHIGAAAPPGTPIAVAAFSANYRELFSQYKGPPQIKMYCAEASSFCEKGLFARYDLGFLELLFTILLSAFLVATWSRRLPTGTYAAVVSLAYAPVRFVMDSYRLTDNDVRYAGLTPAQWQCILLGAFGLFLARIAYGHYRSGTDPLDHFIDGPAAPGYNDPPPPDPGPTDAKPEEPAPAA
jgi:phosphatidylglycerol---prolipoprotein diacylglyceryl transferase